MRSVATMSDMTPPVPADDAMTPEQMRRDQLLAAPNAVESDADPRIQITEHDGITRVDILPDADVRPGNPYAEPGEGARS